MAIKFKKGLAETMIKLSLLLLTLSVFAFFLQPQDPALKVFDTVVTENSTDYVSVSWECLKAPGDLCGERIPRAIWATGSYRFWPKQVVKGQLLKATFFVVQLKSVPSCQERLADAIKDYCQGLDCRPPINSLMPEDCSRQPSQFTADLLEKMSKQ